MKISCFLFVCFLNVSLLFLTWFMSWCHILWRGAAVICNVAEQSLVRDENVAFVLSHYRDGNGSSFLLEKDLKLLMMEIWIRITVINFSNTKYKVRLARNISFNFFSSWLTSHCELLQIFAFCLVFAFIISWFLIPGFYWNVQANVVPTRWGWMVREPYLAFS